MLNIIHDENLIRFKFSSEIKYVNMVIENTRGFLKEFSVENEKNLILILRELLNNAIEHGNKKIMELNVTASIEHIGDMRFKLVVEDEGKGFDYKDLKLSIPEDPTQIRRRGLSLVNAFCDELKFNSIGNCITAYITVKKETIFEISDIDSWKLIKPTGNITAETSESLRILLLHCINEGHLSFRFDLSDVADIDSIALSLFVIFSNIISDKFSNAKLEIINANKDIENLFRMTRLDQKYKIRSA